MTGLLNLTRRNCKLFFKDKGAFFSARITPIILLVLYATFLAKVYHESFVQSLPQRFLELDGMDRLIDATVAGQLISSLLAVSAVTVSFCSNMIMVTDKVTGARNDLAVTPVKRSTMALAYYLATTLVTLAICFIALGAGLGYIASIGWYMSASDVFLLILDVFLLVTFGTALSSIINFFLSSQGQISAVGSIVSAGYGFICGAYMPISSFGKGLQKVISFMPGTYGTSLLRCHAMGGSFRKMESIGFPSEVVESIRDSIDCNLYFFGNKVSDPMKYVVLAGFAALAVLVYVAINKFKKKTS